MVEAQFATIQADMASLSIVCKSSVDTPTILASMENEATPKVKFSEADPKNGFGYVATLYPGQECKDKISDFLTNQRSLKSQAEAEGSANGIIIADSLTQKITTYEYLESSYNIVTVAAADKTSPLLTNAGAIFGLCIH